MYNENEHLELFRNPGRFLFRGTLPSEHFSGQPYSGSGTTPTSVDPIVATLFACEKRNAGSPIVLVALKSEFASKLNGPNLIGFGYESAVNLEIVQSDFEALCHKRVTVERALELLQSLGYVIPHKLPDPDMLRAALQNTPRMRLEEIEEFVARC